MIRTLARGIALSAILMSGTALGADLGGTRTLTPAEAAALPGVPRWTACYGGLEIGGAAAIVDSNRGNLGIDGWGYGLKGGCDYQLGRFVFGAFGGFDWVHLSLANVSTSGVSADEWFVGGRAGVLLTPHTLAYGLVARPEAKLEAAGLSKTIDGISAGGGIEHIFREFPNISASLEYRLEQFDNIHLSPRDTTDLREHTVRLGVNYRFPIGQ